MHWCYEQRSQCSESLGILALIAYNLQRMYTGQTDFEQEEHTLATFLSSPQGQIASTFLV